MRYTVKQAAERLDKNVEDVRELAAELGAQLTGGRLWISEDELAVIAHRLADQGEGDDSEDDDSEDDDSEDDDSEDDDSEDDDSEDDDPEDDDPEDEDPEDDDLRRPRDPTLS